MTQLARLRGFIQDFTRLLDEHPDEARIFRDGRALLAGLVCTDDWLPEAYAQPHPDHYQQYLLHCDPLERFSVVSFVWGPGQSTPVHNHTVWGMVGILRGAELCEEFDAHGQPAGRHELRPGQVDLVSPAVGDVHRVSNLLADQVSVSIHVYGANIGRVQRQVFQPDGTRRAFVSGYANGQLPNLWV